MKHGSEHTIGLLQFDIHTNNELDARKLQDEVSIFSRNEIPEILDISLNHLDDKNVSLVIDKLVIDVGNIGFDDFKLKFLAAIKKVLQEKLSPLKVQNNELLLEGKVVGKVETDFDILKSFLLTGSLPWYSNSQETDLRQLCKKLIRKKNIDLVNLIRLHSNEKDFMDRLASLVPESYYKDIFILFSNRIIWKESAVFKQLLFLFRHFPFAEVNSKSFRLLLFESIIEILSKDSKNGILQLEMSILKSLAVKLNIPIPQLLPKINHSGSLLRKSDLDTKNISQLNIFLHQAENLVEISAPDSPPALIKKISSQSETVTENRDYLVFNAGLVLTNPFLDELFNKLEFLDRGRFVDKQAQIKAMHILQYIATMKSGALEQSLLLNKILCAYPVQEAVPWSSNLKKKEKTEATRMLTALIKHWSALKNTSSTAFRSAFLQRKGILKKIDDTWQLQVERTAYDVLLSRIPWQFENIRLTWMNKELKTIW